MANKKNKINELVSDDDDPTSELEVLTLSNIDSVETEVERESDANTYGYGKRNDPASADSQSIPELKSDLEARTRTIGRLQYDIEQLRSKWLGLETEIGAREEIVNDLSREVGEIKDEVARKDKLLKKREKQIKSLKSDIKQRDESHGLLEQQRAELESQLEDLRLSEAEIIGTLEETGHASKKLRAKLETAQNEITSLKADIDQRDESRGLLEQKHTELESQLDRQRLSETEIAVALKDAERASEKLRTELENARNEIASLNRDIERRDESRDVLERQHAELGEELAEQRSNNAEHVAGLEQAARELEQMRSKLTATQNQTAAEIVLTKQISTATVEEFRRQLDRADKYADTLRHKMQDAADSQVDLSKERDRLNQMVEQMAERNRELSDEIGLAHESIAELQKVMEQQQADHEQEIRTLRFELAEAQDTASESTEMNTQLASELVNSRGFKDELERRLQQQEEKAQDRIARLEKQIRKLKATGEELEQKLETKASAINVLLGELAKKTEQLESLGEIEGVIQDIDDRMSGHIDDANGKAAPEPVAASPNSGRDRVTRVLVGAIGDKELRFPLFKDRLTIGRTHENDIQLKSAFVSRRHAVVVTEGDNTRVIDWGSKNGVFVNSERVKEHFLSNGDIVSVGNAEFRYEERQKRDS
jgi:chromosome segregation ATPase